MVQLVRIIEVGLYYSSHATVSFSYTDFFSVGNNLLIASANSTQSIYWLLCTFEDSLRSNCYVMVRFPTKSRHYELSRVWLNRNLHVEQRILMLLASQAMTENMNIANINSNLIFTCRYNCTQDIKLNPTLTKHWMESSDMQNNSAVILYGNLWFLKSETLEIHCEHCQLRVITWYFMMFYT